jgi:hypothetical protein
MARGITQAQVNHAADALLQRGIRPTIEKLRAELGTGSPNTLMRMIDAWWAGLAERLAAQARADLPGVPEPVQRGMQALWTEAVVAARLDAEARVAEREQQADARLKEVAASQVESQNALAAAHQAREAAQAELATERRRSAELQSALTDALRTLKETQASLEGLRRNGEDERARLRSDLERAVAAETRWLRELDRAREDAKATAREAKAVHNELSREKAKRQRLAEELAVQKRDAKTRIAALERQLKARRRVPAPAKPGRRKKTIKRHPRHATTNE